MQFIRRSYNEHARDMQFLLTSALKITIFEIVNFWYTYTHNTIINIYIVIMETSNKFSWMKEGRGHFLNYKLVLESRGMEIQCMLQMHIVTLWPDFCLYMYMYNTAFAGDVQGTEIYFCV